MTHKSEEVSRTDPMSKDERSVHMSKVRSTGNLSTEIAVEQKLTSSGMQGWEKHPNGILGKPDFYFSDHQLVVFVNGCFWHACPVCKRRIPKSDYWRGKIDGNRRRDNRIHRKLREEGYHVMRIWEHELKQDLWLKRLTTMLRRTQNDTN